MDSIIVRSSMSRKGGSHLRALNYCRRYRPPRDTPKRLIHRPAILDIDALSETGRKQHSKNSG
jgi:hypothetical protein